MAGEEFDEVHFGAHEVGIQDRLRPRRIVPMQDTCNTPYPSSEVVTQLGMEIHWSADDPDDPYVFVREIEDCNEHHRSIHPIHASIRQYIHPSTFELASGLRQLVCYLVSIRSKCVSGVALYGAPEQASEA